jgi:hypothetical protein
MIFTNSYNVLFSEKYPKSVENFSLTHKNSKLPKIQSCKKIPELVENLQFK